jgi:hypothetical protein
MIAGAAAAGDILDLRSTDVRLADWAALAPAARSWWLIGFTLGWHGQDPAAEPMPADAARAGQAEAVTQLLRRAADARHGARRLAAELIEQRLAGTLPLAGVTGHVWLALAPGDRLVLLQGLQAGAYARAIDDRLGATADGAAREAAVADARRRVRPNLALAPNLLFARLSDHYFYTDRRHEPLVSSIATIAAQLGRR